MQDPSSLRVISQSVDIQKLWKWEGKKRKEGGGEKEGTDQSFDLCSLEHQDGGE
jgi:hypothetical protein